MAGSVLNVGTRDGNLACDLPGVRVEVVSGPCHHYLLHVEVQVAKMMRIRVTEIHRPVEQTYPTHLFIVLGFVLALEKCLELFVDKSDTLGDPLAYLILLDFFCPTFGNGFMPQLFLGADEGSENREQRSQ